MNNHVIDEVGGFGDHYHLLNGEALLFGPVSFFMNGPAFPDIDVDRATAGFGINYERGVAQAVCCPEANDC